MSSAIKQTPLDAFHRENGARMVPFAGWEMPVQYTRILDEHRAVRESAGFFDVSHMGEARVTGPEAQTFLDYLVPNNVSGLYDGKALYTCMCYEHGGVVDDLLIYRFGPEDFFLCINAGNTEADIAWLRKQAARFDCHVEDVSVRYAQIALQGPKALDILAPLTPANLSVLKRFHFIEEKVADVPAIISRTGYTGEDGCELYCPADQAATLAPILFASGQLAGLKLCGLGARDSLRLEAGFPLYGHELGKDISPLQAGLGWTVKFGKKSDFIGRAALMAEEQDGLARHLIHFTLDDRRTARQGTPVYCNGQAAGEVVSGTVSPLLNQPIGSAFIKTADFVDTAALYVELRGHRIPLNPKKPPLHKH